MVVRVTGFMAFIGAVGVLTLMPQPGRARQTEPPEPPPYNSRLAPFRPGGPILFTRTPVASYSASGSATFLCGFGSTNAPLLSLQLRGFTPGLYQIGVEHSSDGAFVALADFRISDPTAGPDRETTQNTRTTSNGRQVNRLVSQNVVALRRIADPNDVSKLVVADQWGNYLLIADFHPSRVSGAHR